MILCLDIGNTHIYGGVFKENQLILKFRYPSQQSFTSDQLGVFFTNVLRENNIHRHEISDIAICSVVPSLDYSVNSAFVKYFDLQPFILQSGVKTGLNIRCTNPQEVGADRIANCVGASHAFPNKNMLIVDFGTATTVDILSKDRHFLGGAILPGLKVQMTALHEHTANLPPVSIEAVETAMGKTTLDCIRSGLFFGHLGAIKEITSRLKQECFQYEPCMMIGTGGFSRLFENSRLFDVILPDLVLQGLKVSLDKNTDLASVS